MVFNDLYSKFIVDVWSQDTATQEFYLKYVEELRGIPLKYLREIGTVFIPNNEYMLHFMGPSSKVSGFDIYKDDNCLWTHFVVFPIRNLVNEIVGLVGWDLHNKALQMDGVVGLPMYKTSSKSLFNKNDYFFTDINNLKKNTFDIIFIVDGVFDAITLNMLGYPTIALLGSSVSQMHLYFLRWYRNHYVIADNDQAGLHLLNTLRNSLPNTYPVQQFVSKDIDAFYKLYPDKLITYFNSLMETPRKGLTRLHLSGFHY